MSLSNGTIAFLAAPIFGGNGPSHATIGFVWRINGAAAYTLPEADANKHDRVLYGLRRPYRWRLSPHLKREDGAAPNYTGLGRGG